MAVLNVLINSKGAQAGAAQVRTALTSMSSTARVATQDMERRFERMKSSILSVKTALAALALGAFAREAFGVAMELERAERQMTALTTSAAAARVQLERVRAIGDKFQFFKDEDLASSFRLLVANAVPQAEQALDTIANMAAQTGVDINTATMAIIGAQERQLRQLGVQLIDLGTGKALIAFNGIRIEVQKTDQALQRGLIEVLRKGAPDATKVMANQMEFQFSRVKDTWEDLQVAIMRGGLNDYFKALFKTIADTFQPEQINRAGKEIADATITTLELMAKAAAATYDTIAPFGKLLFSVIKNALDAFGRLPPEIQTIGVVGYLFLGTSGRAALVAALALANTLGLKVEDIGKMASQLGTGVLDLAQGSPLGKMLQKSAELAAGQELKRTPGNTLTPGPNATTLGGLFQGGPEVEKAGEKTDRFFARLRANFQAAQQQTKELAEAGASATTLLKANTLDENAEKVRAQMAFIRANLQDEIALEQQKRDLGFQPEVAEAEKRSLEAISNLEKQGLELNKQQRDTIKGYFLELAKAQLLTADWNTNLEMVQRSHEAVRKIMEQTADLQRDLSDQEEALQQPLGAARREAEIKAQMIRTLEKERVTTLLPSQLDWLQKQATVIAETETRVRGLMLAERQRLDTAEELARLQEETRDLQGGTQAAPIGSIRGAVGTEQPSAETLLARRRREFEREGAGGAFDEATAKQEIQEVLRARNLNLLTRTTFELEREVKQTQILNQVAGQQLDQREASTRALQTELALRQQGVDLGPEEVQRLQVLTKTLQDQRAELRNTDAINGFIDSFRVGFDTIVHSAEQAYGHLEDALTQMVLTGKADMQQFVNFVEAEMVRLSIKIALNKLFDQVLEGAGALFGKGGGAGGSIFGLFTGEGFGAAGAEGASRAAQRGATDPSLFGPGFRHGGVFDYRGGHFRSYYDVPGAQSGMLSYNERLLRVSEGHTPEAVIPLKGGKVPVQMKGGGVTVHAPITIMTPDAAGVRRSEMQIQAQMSSALARAAKRIT